MWLGVDLFFVSPRQKSSITLPAGSHKLLPKDQNLISRKSVGGPRRDQEEPDLDPGEEQPGQMM